MFLGPYNLFCVLMNSSGTLWVFISPYSSLSVLMVLIGL